MEERRKEGQKKGRKTHSPHYLVNQDEVTIKKQVNNMKIEWRWCLSIADEGGEGGGAVNRGGKALPIYHK